jgi:hypothetical protein
LQPNRGTFAQKSDTPSRFCEVKRREIIWESSPFTNIAMSGAALQALLIMSFSDHQT